MQQAIVAYADGASKGNPGPSGAGAVVYSVSIADESQRVELAHGQYFLPDTQSTNNEAEYEALLLLIDCLEALFPARTPKPPISTMCVTVRMDSNLVVQQMLGNYRVRNERMGILHARATMRIRAMPHLRIRFEHVPRDSNKRADVLANSAISAKSPRSVIVLQGIYCVDSPQQSTP